VKVIEKGTGQEGWSTKATCTGRGNGDGGCGAKLLVEEADVFRTESHAMGETDVYYTFECCECHVRTDLNDTKVPHHVKSKAVYRSPRGEG
jgi:hypothetical protein